jgi:hypothetical protein
MPGPPNLGIEGPSAFPRRVRLRLYKGTKPPLSLPDVALPARPSCPAPPTLTSTNVVHCGPRAPRQQVREDNSGSSKAGGLSPLCLRTSRTSRLKLEQL